MGNPSPTGTGLLLNATASTVTGVSLTPSGWTGPAFPALTLFPATQATGAAQAPGCSFPIPPGGSFWIQVQFDSGQRPSASFSTASTAAPAVVVVAFLNLLVLARPSGLAADIAPTASLAAAAPNLKGV